MHALMQRLQEGKGSGVFNVERKQSIADLEAAAIKAGFAYFYIDAKALTTKKQILAKIAQVLEFPDYFGENWDAFDESFGDFCDELGRAALILCDHFEGFATAEPQGFATAKAIFTDTVNELPPDSPPVLVGFMLQESEKAADLPGLKCGRS